MQPSLENEWWADSKECHCHLRSIQDLLSDGRTPYERLVGMPFDGMVEYHPISAKDQSRLRQFGAKVMPGVFCVNLERRHCGRRRSRIGGGGRI